jgi:cytochrome P450/NADPH-cytochrome P450 reductase
MSHCIELQEAATRAQLRELAAFTVCPPHKKELEALIQEDAYKCAAETFDDAGPFGAVYGL